MGTWSIISPTGQEIPLQGLNVAVREGKGGGLPPQRHRSLDIVQGQSSDAPLHYRHSVSRARRIELVLRPRVRDMHLPSIRLALIAALNPDLVCRETPAYLRYRGSTATVQLAVVSDGGLERSGLSEDAPELVIGLLAHDPVWVAPTAHPPVALTTHIALQGGYTFRREARGEQTGVWQAAGALNAPVYALVRGEHGKIYAGGAFSGHPAYVAQWDDTTHLWAPLGSNGGPNGPVLALCAGPSGMLYAGGNFSGRVKRWNGSTWETLSTGGGIIRALALGDTGMLYAGGSGSGGSGYLLQWDGQWHAITGLNGPVFALTRGPNGVLYVGGDFTLPGRHIAAWDPVNSTWSGLGQGLPGRVNALAWLPNGNLVAAGRFSWQDGNSKWGYIAQWNGVTWQPLGRVQGDEQQILALAVHQDGRLYAAGEFTRADGRTLPNPQAQWNGYAWFPLDCALPGSGSTNAVVVGADGSLFLGCDNHGADGSGAGVTMVSYGGTAVGFPIFTITGPGRLYEITNWTTGDSMYMDLVLVAGETLTIDLRPEQKSLTTNLRGNVLGHLVPGSQLASWRLLPGLNTIAIYMTDTNASSKAEIVWYERHWSRDGAGE